MASIQRIRLAGQLAEPISHYTDGVIGGNVLWISGMLATNAAGELVGVGDVEAQTDQVLRNVSAVLEAAGATFDNVVKVGIYVRDMNHRVAINKVRQVYFGASRPASTLVEVSMLAHPDALVEIEAQAVL